MDAEKNVTYIRTNTEISKATVTKNDIASRIIAAKMKYLLSFTSSFKTIKIIALHIIHPKFKHFQKRITQIIKMHLPNRPDPSLKKDDT